MTFSTLPGRFIATVMALLAAGTVCLLLAGCSASEPEAKKPTADQLQQNQQVMKRQRDDR